MTSEVCVMNRLAVVLAADSATTVTTWTEKGKEERYFKGANKIFHVSHYHPMGMMVYDSADLLKVPWDVTCKEFRKHIGNKSFNDVQGYAEEFFAFVGGSSWLFPPDIQKSAQISAMRAAALRPLIRANIDEIEDAGERRAKADQVVAERRKILETAPKLAGLPENPVDILTATCHGDVVAALEVWRPTFENLLPTDINALAELGALELLAAPGDFLGRTGIVFAGFGDHDVFPSMFEYTLTGIVAGSLVREETSKAAINHETPAWLSAFAQTAMSDTFSLGVSQDVFSSIMETTEENLRTLVTEVLAAAGGKLPDDHLEAILGRTTQTIAEAVLENATSDHALPLRRVLSVLPIEEMAELAETLINLQSLKEKVTKPSETVGGPVDVAVITRGEGLVWLKRKHFFDTAINPRYLDRQAALYK